MDNDTFKEKIRSYSTLNSLYHETQQEMELLNKQIQVKDNIIADLKARLGRYESIYMAVGNKESLLVGPSKSLLESLCEEICKLKQSNNDMDLRASRQAEVNHDSCTAPSASRSARILGKSSISKTTTKNDLFNPL